MNNVVCGVMVAPGDINFLSKNLVVVTVRLGTGFHDAKIGASTRLCEIHGSRPLARINLGKVRRFDLIVSVRLNSECRPG